MGGGRLQQTAARLAAARRLAEAIAECHPVDAVAVLAAALEDLAAGEPPTFFMDLKQEAAVWAAFANPFELDAYFTAIQARMAKQPISVAQRHELTPSGSQS